MVFKLLFFCHHVFFLFICVFLVFFFSLKTHSFTPFTKLVLQPTDVCICVLPINYMHLYAEPQRFGSSTPTIANDINLFILHFLVKIHVPFSEFHLQSLSVWTIILRACLPYYASTSHLVLRPSDSICKSYSIFSFQLICVYLYQIPVVIAFQLRLSIPIPIDFPCTHIQYLSSGRILGPCKVNWQTHPLTD